MSKIYLTNRRKFSSRLLAMILSILLILPSVPVFADTEDMNTTVVNQEGTDREETGVGKESGEQPEEGELPEGETELEGDDGAPEDEESEGDDGAPEENEREDKEELTEGEEELPGEGELEGGEILPEEGTANTAQGLIQAMGAYNLLSIDYTADSQSELTGAITTAGSDPSVIDITDTFQLDAVLEIPAGSDITLISTTGEVILSAEGKRHFEVSGSLTLGQGIILDGGTGNSQNPINTYSGGIEGKPDSEITLDGGVIQYCTATSNGGGIYAENSVVTIQSGSVENCTATGNGGGIYVSIYGSPANANSGLTMRGGKIQENLASRGGGVYSTCSIALSNHRDYGMEISGGAITYNKATSNGGGIYQVLGTVRVSDKAEISFNTAVRGGGIESSSTEIVMTGGSVDNNIASEKGGGIVVHSKSGSTESILTVTGGSISYNKAEGNYDGGGGISWTGYIGETITIENAQLIGNEASGANGGGGAIQLLDNVRLVVKNSLLEDNSAASGGAINIIAQSGKKITAEIGSNVSFIENMARYEGSAIFFQDETYTADGAQLFIEGENIVFEGNKAIGTANSQRGAVVMESYDKVGIFTIKGTANSPVIFDNNGIETSRNGHGGAVYTLTNIEAENVIFRNNYIDAESTGTTVGGAVYANDGGTFENCIFDNNKIKTASGMGGAVYLTKAGNFTNSIFRKNKIEFTSGGTGNGGGIYIPASGTGKFTDCFFEENSAIQGGALFLGGANNRIEDSEIVKNTAETNGGGLYMVGSTHIEEVLVKGNYADKDGGGIFVGIADDPDNDYKILTAKNITFDDNTAGNGAFAFNLTDDDKIEFTHDTNLIGIVSLSLPFGLGRANVDGFGYNKALNNYDINYNSARMANGVIYHPNGGEGDIYIEEIPFGGNHSVLDNDTDINLGYTKEGYAFLGWSTSEDGNVIYTGGESISGITGNIYLYARWAATAKITKETDKTTAKAGDTLTYTITVEGAEKVKWTGLFTDALDGNVTYTGNYSIQVWDSGAWKPSSVLLQEAGGTLSADLTIEPGSSYLIEFTATINKGAEGKDITNTAVITGDADSGDYVSNTVTTKVQADEVKEPGEEPGGGEKPSGGNEGGRNGGGGGGYVSVNNKKNDTKAGEEPVAPERNPDLNYDDHFAYVVGYPDGNIRPENNITRAEAATIFFRLITDEARNRNRTMENSFNDVNEDDWFNIAVSTMSKMGIISGYPDGSFRPGDNITRAELATITALFAADSGSGSIHFSDTMGHWAQGYIEQASGLGWVSGYPDGSYRPNTYITRAEVMSMVNRMLERVPENTGDLLDDMIHWPDNSDVGSWYYIAVQEATNSHSYERKAEGYYETWRSLRENRDWIKLESPLYWNN